MYRKEYPRPQWVRKEWMNLNGKWQFDFDDYNIGLKNNWQSNEFQFQKEIEVPFAYQSEVSGIQEERCHDIIWYKKTIKIPQEWKGKKIKLNFGAVDYRCFVYVNEIYIGYHEGGHTAFSFDITDALTWDNETITLRVEDPSYDETIPRGKQTWEEKPRIIWYTRTSGIWQTVWLEPIDESSIINIKYTPNINNLSMNFDIEVTKECLGKKLDIFISFKDKKISHDLIDIDEISFERNIQLSKNKIFDHGFHGRDKTILWSPENPNLFDVTFKIIDETYIYDSIDSYFGLRSIHSENGLVYLNNKPFYQKLVLNQGYWRKSLMTAPSDEDFIKDIQLIKDMGFNGCRIHQKVEDPRFLYWADKLGFIIWGECAAFISYDIKAAHRLTNEWYEIIERDYNHPSIITWTPINESWGVEDIINNKQQQAYALSLYYFIKSLDTTRLVVSNDGWESVTTDICGVHNYAHGQEHEVSKYNKYVYDLKTAQNLEASMPANRTMYVQGFKNNGEPFILTEYGGIAYTPDQEVGWGYTVVNDEETFLKDYRRIMKAIYSSEALQGYCYTQLTDVEQEINGLLTFDHEPKVSVEKIKEINDMDIHGF